MSRLAIILPPDLDTPLHWLTFDDGVVTGSGQGDDWPRLDPNGEGVPTPAMLVAPAAAVTLHRALLPDLAPRQALAAARLMAVENALGMPEELHVAVGPRDAFLGEAAGLLEAVQAALHAEATERLRDGIEPVADWAGVEARFAETARNPGWAEVAWSRPSGDELDAVV